MLQFDLRSARTDAVTLNHDSEGDTAREETAYAEGDKLARMGGSS